jgi:hypothetical protein
LWGSPGDIPTPGDYDGDGKTDFATYHLAPSGGTWIVASSQSGATGELQWGSVTDIPVPADFDGDGRTDYAVFRPSNGTFYIASYPAASGAPFTGALAAWGLPFNIPTPKPAPLMR